MTIGERIRYRREEIHMTQQELAEKVGYKGKTAISKIEAGERELRQSMISPMASALNTTIEFIMGWDSTDPDPTAITLSPVEQELVEICRDMNTEGQEELLKHGRLLRKSGDYNIYHQPELVEKEA